ncbi:MAG TPA: histidine phosphatase family protein [Thermoflexales bacterium]|nr:histidine phosphatase family protein [Thermoflexales bacterium]HQW33801.1 histidine phosphatase family protein [Thermoflexales bacterium]HQZ21664.1 histidine phosphatase family protein [Thermoflexales bacterium]
MPILLLIRHATNDFVKAGKLPGQLPNIHLNEEGRAQAEALGEKLKAAKIAAVYSSSLERALETAWRVAKHHGLPVQVTPRLMDTDAGAFAGRTIKDLNEGEDTRETWKHIVEKPLEARLPAGESLLEMRQRVVAEIERIAAAHPDPISQNDQPAQPQTIAIVMHSDTVKAALAHFLGTPFEHFQRMATSPASISGVHVGQNQANILFVNRLPYQDLP